MVADGTPIPTNAVAVTGNLTVTGQTKAGYIVLAPAAGGATSTLNFPVGDTRANGVTVALGSGGTLNADVRGQGRGDDPSRVRRDRLLHEERERFPVPHHHPDPCPRQPDRTSG